MKFEITDSIKYIGVNDKKIDLFENQYIVPNGISYNSYLIRDEKNVVMDTVDKNATDEWLENLERELAGEDVDYLVISHLEPDHSYNIKMLCEKYPEMKLIGNVKTFAFLPQFFDIENLDNRKVVVTDGEEITFGMHTLKFIMAPMVHWPEVMVSYEKREKILFSADGFGKFGTLDTDEEWTCEARRYYFNIVGKYGIQVQALLKKMLNLDVQIICPLHGPILKDNLAYYIEKYDIWSSYKPEDEGVFIAYASIHDNTKIAAEKLATILKEKGVNKVAITDLCRCDMAEAIEDAFRYDKMILASSSYDGGLFTPMDQFVRLLKNKNYQNRKVGIIENGTWAPCSARIISDAMSEMKNISLLNTVVTLKTTLKEENVEQLEKLADEVLSE